MTTRTVIRCLHQWGIDGFGIGTCKDCGATARFENGNLAHPVIIKEGKLPEQLAAPAAPAPAPAADPPAAPRAKVRRGHGGSNAAKHKFVEDHRSEIVHDLVELGEKAMLKKWNLSPTGWDHIAKRWQIEIKGDDPPEPRPSRDGLPELPAFQNQWDPRVQVAWLELYSKLSTVI
jgi:hypothetical protein